MKDRRSQLKNRVVSEALGWYHRRPTDIMTWIAGSPGALESRPNTHRSGLRCLGS